MSEVSSLPIPELDKQVSSNRLAHLAGKVGNKALDFLGRETVSSNKERLVDGAVLGAVALGSTIAEYKYGHEFRHSPFPVGFLVYSGKHFLVGNLAAARVNAQSKFNNLMGIMAASMAGDVAAEAGQSAAMTGLVHHGWENVGGFIKPDQVFWGNAKDAAAALIAGGAVYARSRMTNRNELQTDVIALQSEEPLYLAPSFDD